MPVLLYYAISANETRPILLVILGALTSGAGAFVLGDPVAMLLGYCLGRADYSPKWKAALWAAATAFFSYRLYDFIVVGLRSDADIYKPFFVWQLFLLVLLIPIGALVCHKKH